MIVGRGLVCTGSRNQSILKDTHQGSKDTFQQKKWKKRFFKAAIALIERGVTALFTIIPERKLHPWHACDVKAFSTIAWLDLWSYNHTSYIWKVHSIFLIDGVIIRFSFENDKKCTLSFSLAGLSDCTLGCPKNTLFLNFASFFESLVRMGVQRPQKKFQRYRPINDT